MRKLLMVEFSENPCVFCAAAAAAAAAANIVSIIEGICVFDADGDEEPGRKEVL
jgi:hypothetical protein